MLVALHHSPLAELAPLCVKFDILIHDIPP